MGKSFATTDNAREAAVAAKQEAKGLRDKVNQDMLKQKKEVLARNAQIAELKKQEVRVILLIYFPVIRYFEYSS